jgi:hypothetical protein
MLLQATLSDKSMDLMWEHPDRRQAGESISRAKNRRAEPLPSIARIERSGSSKAVATVKFGRQKTADQLGTIEAVY